MWHKTYTYKTYTHKNCTDIRPTLKDLHSNKPTHKINTLKIPTLKRPTLKRLTLKRPTLKDLHWQKTYTDIRPNDKIIFKDLEI